MAQNDKSLGGQIEKIATPKTPFIADASVRDRFIEIAFKELVAAQVSDWKVNHEMAATLAVRYANAVMKERQNTEVLNLVVSKGTTATAAPVPPPVPAPTSEVPKSISEIIGEAPALQELK